MKDRFGNKVIRIHSAKEINSVLQVPNFHVPALSQGVAVLEKVDMNPITPPAVEAIGDMHYELPVGTPVLPAIIRHDGQYVPVDHNGGYRHDVCFEK